VAVGPHQKPLQLQGLHRLLLWLLLKLLLLLLLLEGCWRLLLLVPDHPTAAPDPAGRPQGHVAAAGQQDVLPHWHQQPVVMAASSVGLCAALRGCCCLPRALVLFGPLRHVGAGQGQAAPDTAAVAAVVAAAAAGSLQVPELGSWSVPCCQHLLLLRLLCGLQGRMLQVHSGPASAGWHASWTWRPQASDCCCSCWRHCAAALAAELLL
jgi:hypothetical protein